jgi:hypothetical protein
MAGRHKSRTFQNGAYATRTKARAISPAKYVIWSDITVFIFDHNFIALLNFADYSLIEAQCILNNLGVGIRPEFSLSFHRNLWNGCALSRILLKRPLRKPRQGPRKAHGPPPFPDAGTAQRGHQTARAGRLRCRNWPTATTAVSPPCAASRAVHEQDFTATAIRGALSRASTRSLSVVRAIESQHG